MICRTVRQQDEQFCGSCGLRWPADEPQPPCPSEEILVKQYATAVGLKRLAQERWNNRR